MKPTIRVLENRIHTSIAHYLRLVIKRPSRFTTVEVSNQQSGHAAMLRQMALKRKGVVSGWPDIELFWKRPEGLQMIFFEVKAEGEKAKPHQLALHEELREDGHKVYVVYSREEVESILKELGVI